MTVRPTVSIVSTDDAWKSLEITGEWSRFADAKAGALVAAAGLLAGLMIQEAPTLRAFGREPVRAGLLAVALVSLVVTAALCLHALLPRTGIGAPRSLIHFEAVAGRYTDDQASFVDAHLRLVADPERLRRQIAEQIWANSVVAHRKYRNIKLATYSLAVAMATGAAAGILGRLV